MPIYGAQATPVAGTGPSVSFIWTTVEGPGPPLIFGNVAVDPQCNLWVMDFVMNRFLIYDLAGQLLQEWGALGDADGLFNFGGNAYYGSIAFASDGGFYVADVGNNRVQQFAADRTFVRSWTATDETGRTFPPIGLRSGPMATSTSPPTRSAAVSRPFRLTGN